MLLKVNLFCLNFRTVGLLRLFVGTVIQPETGVEWNILSMTVGLSPTQDLKEMKYRNKVYHAHMQICIMKTALSLNLFNSTVSSKVARA
jgi:hypothetical protein